jgi:NADH-quinone oxidoreductase subunit L
MVTAGVYMVARMSALYALAPAVMAIVAVVGAATALFAALIGFAQNDFKKVLAYSTVSQLGFMFAAVGSGAHASGIFHLFTHAFFKAGLFLCAGSVMHAMSGSGDIRTMGGLSKRLPWTHGVFLICWLAICGIPPFSGFFSKDGIVAAAFATEAFGADLAWVGPAVGVALLAAALGTAFYMSRLYFLVFTGSCRADEHTKHHIHESPSAMVVPLVVLAAGALLAGMAGLPGERNWIAHFLEPSVGAAFEIPHRLEVVLMVASVGVALAGIMLAAVFYSGGYRAPAEAFARAVPGVVNFVRQKCLVDELYDRVIVRPIRAFSNGLFYVVDRILIDRLLVHGVSFVVDSGGRIMRMFQVGDVQRYLAVFTIGVALLFWVVSRPAVSPDLSVKINGTLVQAEVTGGPAGQNLIYSFDFDDDGAFDRVGQSSKQGFPYEGRGSYNIRVLVRDLRWGTVTTLEKQVSIR